MAEKALSSADLEFGSDELEFGPDGGSGSSAQPADLRDLAISLARQIFGAQAPGMASVLGQGADVIKQPVEFGKGLISGAKRNDFETESALGVPQPLANQLGQAAGRYGLPVAAAAAAPFVAPAAAPAALTAALGPGIAGALTGAAVEGAAAGVGDAASMGLSAALGGNAPDSIAEGAKSAAMTGAETALASVGLSGAVGAIKAVAPRFLQSLQIVPAESLARMIEKEGKPLNGGKLTQTGAELKAGAALRRVQKGVESRRSELGKGVDSALQEFHKSSKGQPVINAAGIADEATDVIRRGGVGGKDGGVFSGDNPLDDVGHEAIDAAIPKAEIEKITEIANAIRKQPNLNPMQAVKLRQAIDNLTKFNSGGVQQVSSDIGQRAVQALDNGLRHAIEEAAKRTGNTKLLKANREFSQFAREYAGISADIGTKRLDSGAMLAKVRDIAGRFNSGGLSKDRLSNIGKLAPGAAKDADALLDYVAAREFILGVKKTPSGISMALLRSLLPGLGIARALPVAKQAEAVTKLLTRAGVAGVASKVNQPDGRTPRP